MAKSRQARIVAALAGIGGSKFASITFRKVSDGTLRTLTINPRAKVGLVANPSPAARRATKTRERNNPDLINVYSVHDRAWRSLYAENVLSIKVEGVEISL